MLRNGRWRRRRLKSEGRGAPLELARAALEPGRGGEQSARPKGAGRAAGRPRSGHLRVERPPPAGPCRARASRTSRPRCRLADEMSEVDGATVMLEAGR